MNRNNHFKSIKYLSKININKMCSPDSGLALQKLYLLYQSQKRAKMHGFARLKVHPMCINYGAGCHSKDHPALKE